MDLVSLYQHISHVLKAVFEMNASADDLKLASPFQHFSFYHLVYFGSTHFLSKNEQVYLKGDVNR
ncbi:hypothetical protein BK049_02000 [Bacillus xiamenensis]|uniref:Uncharacterized protein n=1 Tax=Bacillus xiamenensis TaxID=1178537 RepID=A0AAC9IHA5_9BACI|nr:hypothetical protein BK049_02000 [Bacillus xiamenensis]EKF34961.1 hypothetical protein BA1_12604 [Bacillus xiamenensis]MBG9912349.1 hypothetical protein [Bacillus xiamenensis]